MPGGVSENDMGRLSGVLCVSVVICCVVCFSGHMLCSMFQ